MIPEPNHPPVRQGESALRQSHEDGFTAHCAVANVLQFAQQIDDGADPGHTLRAVRLIHELRDPLHNRGTADATTRMNKAPDEVRDGSCTASARQIPDG
ncbi:hypothetical protein IX56_06345 [Paracoccus sanguinis]|uniref:Uncharacterized protein n=1 Tax=Paracoccus sanguinis TaxID=1545044 RepID=A0A099GIS5_9RHOB|nr:hypothetical protein IX56_06345 [Paracoccus sanguinis]